MKGLAMLLLLLSVPANVAPTRAFGAPGTVPSAPSAPSAPAAPPAATAPAIDPSRPLAAPEGAPDIQFVSDLIGLHEDAITTARRIMVGTDDPALRALAEQTILQRQREILLLREWQKSH